MKRPLTTNRRAFLRGLGVSAAAAPFLPLLDSLAEGSTYPQRLLLFYTPHGFNGGTWEPTISGPNYTVGPTLAPLNPWLKKIVVTQGMGFPPVNVESHGSGLNRCWSGTDLNPGPSIDQMIAAQIGSTTAFPSIQLGVPVDSYNSSMIFSAPNRSVAPEMDPAAAVKRIFSSISSAQFTKRSRIADMLKGELATIRGRISSADYAKVDGHLAGLNALQQSVQACSAAIPQVPYANFPDGEVNVPAILKNQMQIVASAFACDLTRVASIQLAGLNDPFNTYDFLNIATTDNHHGITHNAGVDGALTALSTIQTFYATQFASLLALLDAIPEGPGTMLDNTLVVWGTETSDATSHSNQNMPFILAGSGGGAFKTGFSLIAPTNLTVHRLLVTICQGFGLTNVRSLSNQDPSSGVLPGLLVGA